MQAYVNHADVRANPDQSALTSMLADTGGRAATIDGLPDWATSIRYTIQAEVPGDASRDMMMGPMMQWLLEDRFQLKLRVTDKDVPAYDLVVTKGGAKLPQHGKAFCRGMLPPKAGETGPPVAEPGDRPRCTMQFSGVSIADLARLIEGLIGANRPVVDKTGITGRYQIRMLWAPNWSQIGVPPPDSQADPSNLPDLFEAVKEQLGLELVPSKATVKQLVIDHIEEPTPN